ncbi:MAG: aldo/keto reductase [Clostridia bacterium]|nr:aldo/keto reductase [Clostridia bacterium]
MQYRHNLRTGDRISVIGGGTAYLYQAGQKEGVRALRTALEGGINYYDLATSDARTFPIFREAFSGKREQVMYQVHFGADYTHGSYGWSLDANTVRRSIELQLKELGTDYIDYGFIHCQDEHSDWATYKKHGILELLEQMRQKGIVRHIGLSSHTPEVINAILDEVEIDMLMFSVNAGYDLSYGEYANGSREERDALYTRCASSGIGISVMKPFSGGQLLDARLSPFGFALSPYQCIRYCLDRPGILTVLPGIRNTQDVELLLGYDRATDAQTDYARIAEVTDGANGGRCVYCGHCSPCPAGLDIALINKYYDLAKLGDQLACDHYASLEKNAKDCIHCGHCGHCDRRCPFGVSQSAHMDEIAAWFAL